MINIEELMVGDYVYDSVSNAIVQIKSSDLLIINNEFRPLYLIDSVLEGIGFEATTTLSLTTYSIEYCGAIVRFERWNDKPNELIFEMGGDVVSIRYVHELQHILRILKLTDTAKYLSKLLYNVKDTKLME